MVKLEPEAGAPSEDLIGHSSGGRAFSSSTWGFESSRSASAGKSGADAPPGKETSDSSGGGRFWRRLLPRRPGGEGNRIDLRNTWQVVAGSILIPLGIVFILIAWYGSAHTGYVQQQIPYLVSGSFAGLACIVLGGLFYWAHWLYRLYDQADQHHEEQLQAMQLTLSAIAERLPCGNGWGAPQLGGPAPLADPREAQPGRAAPQVPSAPSSPATERPRSPDPVSAAYVVTSSGTVYHTPSCPIITHHAEGLRVLGTGAVLGMEACQICLPGHGPRTEG